LSAPHAAAADAYPAKPLRFVVAFPPGGGTDIIARSIAQKLAERIAQQVVVDNRPGAGGNIGTDMVAKSAPERLHAADGSAGPLAINASLFGKMPFDPIKDLAPVTLAASDAECARRAPVASGDDGQGADRARQGETGRNQLRLFPGTERPRTWRGSCSTRWRSQDGSRAVQGGSAGARRPARRPGAADVLDHAARATAREGREAACSRGDKCEALRRRAGTADGR